MPPWAVTFQCDILSDNLSVDELEEVAGRLQAQAATVKAMTTVETLDYFYRLQQRHPDWNKNQLLQATYKRTGKTVADGTVACYCLRL